MDRKDLERLHLALLRTSQKILKEETSADGHVPHSVAWRKLAVADALLRIAECIEETFDMQGK